jgi:cobalt-precorrin-5B (C1)-methyltransferase
MLEVDPVTGLEIPPGWIKLSDDPEVLQKIKSGRWVILCDGRLLRRGLTTGTTAAAACKGAVLSLQQPLDSVEVPTPADLRVCLPIRAKDGVGVAVKDSGDHQFDVTRGIEIIATARTAQQTEIVAGEGIGMILKAGLCAPQGKPAISRSAREQILAAVDEAVGALGLRGASVEISIPRGREIAEKTLNPKVGVHGGISILGSTGFVEPWNDHLAESKAGELAAHEKVVVTTGRTGLKFSRILFPDHFAVLIGSELDRLSFEPGQDSVLCGLPALILKWAWPELLQGTGYGTVAEMVERDPANPHIDRALAKAKTRIPHTRIVLLHKNGKIFREVP